MVHTKNLIGFLMVAILALAVIYNPYTNTYISQLKNNAIHVHQTRTDLYDEIKRAAENYNIPPNNAKIDRVWKAMPGYNGIKVDINASYEKMKKDQVFDERKLVFIQNRPEINLADLPAAPVFRGHPDKPMVSFLFNVAWGNEYLPEILAILKENQVQATFFLEGRWVKENPNMAKMIADNSHELGNHSYSQPKMKILSASETKEEIRKTNEIIEATTGKKAVWFGPPGGSYRDETVQIAHSLRLRTVMWSVDTLDWRKPSQSVLMQQILSKVHPGAMILMHPTEVTTKSLDQLISELKSRNLRIGTVSKLMDEERIIKISHSNHNYEQK